jgi:cell division protein FtsB
MSRITRLQNDIAGLQAALAERNREIAKLNSDLSKERAENGVLRAQVEKLRNPETAIAP